MKDKKVLLGDVVDINNYLIKKRLVSLGMDEKNIIAVNNGIDAVKLAKGQLFDIIILGVSMVGMDGIKASKKIKYHYKESAPKIIGTTSQPLEKIETFDEVIENPASVETFNEKILHALNMMQVRN